MAIVAIGAVVDLLTKRWAWFALGNEATRWSDARRLALEGRLLNVFEFVWQPNYGAVLGVGQGQTSLFIAFTFLALALLVWLFIDSRKPQWALQIFLACVVAGAVGNLYDRMRFSYVRDLLRFKFRADWASWGGPDHYIYPYVFNIADVFITVGVLGLFLVWLTAFRRHKGRPADDADRRKRTS